MTKMIKETASDVESDAVYPQDPGIKGGLRGWCKNNKRFMIFVGVIVIVLAVAVVTPIVALKKDGKPWTLDNHEKALKEEMPSFGSDDNGTSRIGTLPTGSIIRTATSDDDSSDATTAFSRTSITAEIVPTDTESSASSVETTLSEPVATATD